MPADYKSRGRAREKKTLPGFVWLLAGLAIGLFVALLVYLDAQPKTGSSFSQAVQKELDKIKPRTAADTDSSKTSEKQEPKFNFYTILPELEVLIPDSETRPPENKNKASVKNGVVAGKQYILQAGSFRRQDDADKLKATLALLGFEASVQNVTINREAWHRVRLGPYTNTSELYRNINQLHEHDINAMPMELRQE